MAKQTQKTKTLVKQDSNFLEYPTYTLRRHGMIKEIVINRENGLYRIGTHNPKLPDRLDRAILYYILDKIWKGGFKSREVKTTRYRIARDVIGATGKNEYKRVMDGLKRWENMSVEFKGIFYDGDNYATRFFGFLDDVILDEKTKELTIRANEQFLEQQRMTKYYRLLDWRDFRNFKRDVAARLYEMLLTHSLPWKIEAANLVEKLTLSEKYPAHMISKIIPAINEINEKTNLNLKFTHYKNDEGKTIFVFESQAKRLTNTRKHQMKFQFPLLAEELPKDTALEEPSDERIDMLVARSITRTTACKLVEKYPDRIEKYVDILDYLMEKRDTKVTKNPAGYLRKSIEENFTPPKDYISKEERLEIEARQREIIERAKIKTERQRKYDEAFKQLNKNVKIFLETLPPEERTTLEQRILEAIPKERRAFKPYVASIMFDVIKEEHFKKDVEHLTKLKMEKYT